MRLLQARVVVSRVATNGVGLCAVAKLFEAAVRDDCSTSMATYRGQSSHPVESTVTQTTIPCTVDAVRRDCIERESLVSSTVRSSYTLETRVKNFD